MEEQIKESKLGTQPMGRLLVGMSLPLMISMLVQALYNIVDGIYVAQLSGDALAATTLAFPIQMLMIAVATGTGVGISSLLSRRLGQKRYEEANAVATHSIILAICSSLIFVLIGLFFTQAFIALFTENQTLIELGSDYLWICCVASMGIFVGVTGERLLQVTGKTVLSMLSQLSGAVINIIFDPILIFGRYGFPKMGIRGAAIATVAGQIVACIVALTLNKCMNKAIHFQLRGFRFDRKIVGDIYKVGLPTIVMQSIVSVTQMGMNWILEGFATAYVSILGIYYKLQSFVFMPVFGLTQGLVPIIGYNFGAKRPERLKRAIKLAIIAAVSIMLAGTALFQLWPDKLLSLFEADAFMMAAGMRALRIISFNFVFAAIAIVLGCVLQGIGNGIFSLFNSIMRQLVVLLPVAYLLANYVSVDHIWFAFVASEVMSLLFTVFVFYHIYHKRIKTLA